MDFLPAVRPGYLMVNSSGTVSALSTLSTAPWVMWTGRTSWSRMVSSSSLWSLVCWSVGLSFRGLVPLVEFGCSDAERDHDGEV